MVGRDGGAFGLAGCLYAGLLTLLRLTTLFSSGVVGLTTPYKRLPLWLLPFPCFALLLTFILWKSIIPLSNGPLAFLYRRCAMFDNTPLEQEELLDQCRVLVYATMELKDPQVKEILMFILAERLEMLHGVQEHETASVARLFETCGQQSTSLGR